ncbi:hypothetical protein [Streptomyces sp. V1I1]|uniref:hypothetical protein n=1 Tax=Streptomyces sp. V1I1 TaxID=3042272 RepID=UPI0027854B69|nr:hypothetical protein [Streptomyces sp. V1I1]MDQ0941302.1 hypothetical protein [Streptomyces sp. V1I1]
MTAAAARSAAVLCALRRAAGERRALRVMLFLGGLLTVGFLYGGQAQAAELPDSAPSSQAPADTEASDPASSTRPVPARELRRAATDSVDAAASIAPVRSVREVLQPAAGTVADVVGPVVEPVTGTPGEFLPVPPPSAGGGTDPGQPQGPADRLVDESPGGITAKPSSDEADPARSSGATVAAVGPAGEYDGEYAGALGRHPGEVPHAQPASAPAPAQVPGKPCNSTHGALQQSTETHTPRKGDQPAAVSAYDSPYALVSGAVRATAAAPTCERPRDILEFPG